MSMMEELLKNFKALPKRDKYVYLFAIFVLVSFSFYAYVHKPLENFPFNEVVTIEEGESLQNITNFLHDAHVIKFPFVFRTAVIVLGGERKVIAGDYLLNEKVGPVDIAYRLTKGEFHTESKKVTIPEGWDIFEIGDFLEDSLVDFNKEEFLRLAKNKEGYLFPDTYFITNATRPRSIIKLMNNTFEAKIKNITGLATTTYSLDEIITMASIIEGEANTPESRRIVSGILWKRLSMGMPLQVDSTFSYINGKGTAELTLDDLEIDSPYNTYEYKGLPPTPISNPGIDAIEATLNPTKTKYLYFLTGKNGKMYYAITFDQHKKNKERYLYN
ncbi:MAG: UPF0755 protein [Parcubacteria group bacterium Gr01-1014_46]|nr:MAG: UPF0755 protein [Parcubacteria group bacterium Gr01-1014_46]